MKFRSGLEKKFHTAFKLPYEQNRLTYEVVHRYTPDFTLAPNRYVETKGLFVGADRNKHLYIKKQHPEVKVLFVFQNPHKTLTKKSKTTYASWCDKNGFKWLHIDEIGKHTTLSMKRFLETP